MLHTNISNICS